MRILVNNRQKKIVDFAMLKKSARYALAHESVPEDSELSIALVDEPEIQELNNRYRRENTSTDVLAFPLEEGEPERLLGDVVICPPIAERQAKEYDHDIDREMCLLLIHGILHLVGYDHAREEEAGQMRDREQAIMRKLFRDTASSE